MKQENLIVQFYRKQVEKFNKMLYIYKIRKDKENLVKTLYHLYKDS